VLFNLFGIDKSEIAFFGVIGPVSCFHRASSFPVFLSTRLYNPGRVRGRK
jgi:hypothetical protein